MRYVLLALATMSAATLVSRPQTLEEYTRETERYLLNEPAVTYKLTARGRGVTFCNRTPVKVTGFRLGCVESRDGELSVLKELEFQEWGLAAAGETTHCASWGSIGGFPLAGCSEGLFAAVEVRLEDGTTWKLKP